MSHKTINYKNISLSYYEKGHGETILFLHGFLANATMWNDYALHFSTSHHTIAVDLLGHGSTECLGYIHTMEDMADAIHAIILENEIEQITLIGHSMGGYVALAFGELYPDLVNRIILIASSTQSDSTERKLIRERSVNLVKKNCLTYIKLAMTNMFTEEDRLTYYREIELATSTALTTSAQGVIAALEGMKVRTDREILLHFAPYPINLIFGRYDSLLKLEEALVQTEGTTTTYEILDGGHMLHIDNKLLLQEKLSQFINREL